MKKNIITLLFLSAFFAAAYSGCGKKGTGDSFDQEADFLAETENPAADPTGTDDGGMDTENAISQLTLGSAVEIPENFDRKPSEEDANGQLEMVIAEYCKIPEEEYQNVRYYYNYVDLNGDGQTEILALALGQDVKGIQGNILLWADAGTDDVTAEAVKQSFRQAGAPVYISSHTTKGHQDLIIAEHADAVSASARVGSRMADKKIEPRGAGGEEAVPYGAPDIEDSDDGIAPISLEQGYRLLTWTGERYQELEEGTVLDQLDGYEGTAILASSIKGSFANDNGHFLGEGMR